MLTSIVQLVRRICVVVGLAFAASVTSAMDRPPAASEVNVRIEQYGEGRLRVTYKLTRYRKFIAFEDVRGGYRKASWAFESPEYKFTRKYGQDHIERVDGAKFDKVTLIAAPNTKRLKKDYQPIVRYGDGGVMIYTGHFWPVTTRGGRFNATFTLAPAPGAKVVAFGERDEVLEDWRSPFAHPAFVYFGPLAPVETPQVMAVVDPDAPQWIIDEFYELTPMVFEHLAEVFGFPLGAKPNLFLAAPLGKEEGRLSYAGDALPGQFQITLMGAAWKNKTNQSLDIFRSSTVHEAVHLWQAAARPTSKDIAAWIHEGAADAIAAETLLAINYWDEADHAEYFLDARDECARGLELGSLSSAAKRRNYRAMYACGHVIAEAVSIAEGQSIADFWRRFVQVAQEERGYTEKLFYKIVLERSQNQQFVDQLKLFVRTPLADPDREIGRLLTLAHATTPTNPLAPSEGR